MEEESQSLLKNLPEENAIEEIPVCTEDNFNVAVVNDNNTEIPENADNQGDIELERVRSGHMFEKIDEEEVENTVTDESDHSIPQNASVIESVEHQENEVPEEHLTFEET